MVTIFGCGGQIHSHLYQISLDSVYQKILKLVPFWATVVLSVLSCLSVTLVYCGQTVGRIKLRLGIGVGLGGGGGQATLC